MDSENNQLLPINEITKQTLAEANLTVQHMLSSIKQQRHIINGALSAVPAHPFERLKLQYLGPNPQPLTLDSIVVPESFDDAQMERSIDSIKHNHQQLAYKHHQYLQQFGEHHPAVGNAFAVLSGNNLVIDGEKLGKHLQLIELLANLPEEAVLDTPIVTLKKLLWQYCQIHG